MNLVDKRKQDQMCKTEGLACGRCSVSACSECRKATAPDLIAKLCFMTKVVKVKSRIALPETFDLYEEFIGLKDSIAYNLASSEREAQGIKDMLAQLSTVKTEKLDKICKYFDRIIGVLQRMKNESTSMLEAEFAGLQDNLIRQQETMTEASKKFSDLRDSVSTFQDYLKELEVPQGKPTKLNRYATN